MVQAQSFVYVSVSGEKKIAVLKMANDGSLTRLKDVEPPGAPGPMAVDMKRKVLFASLRSSSQLASFRLDAATGGLTLINSVGIQGDAAYVATDRSGNFLLSACYGQGMIGVHPLGEDGTIGETPVVWQATEKTAHAILTDLSNRFLYVPHPAPKAVFQFSFEAKTGKIAALEPPRLLTGDNSGPRHLAFHPKLKMVYFDYEQGSAVAACALDTQTGQLTIKQTLPTLPADFQGNNTCADIEISPSGRFLYSSNRGHDSIAMYAVDEETGLLTSLGQEPTEKTPRSFNIDPSERFLYAAGQGSGQLASYHLDPETGRLKRFATMNLGKSPAWVQVVQHATE